MAKRKTVVIGVLASGGGTNMQAIIDRIESGSLDARIAVVVGNNSGAGALDRARRHGIPAFHLSRLTHPSPDELDRVMVNILRAHGVQWLVLAGYMRQVGRKTLTEYRDRILNIHPALLPKYGGEGMYGIHVHEAVIDAGETETGVTVHLVTEKYDTGPIIAQRCVAVRNDDTPGSLQKRVLVEEHRIYADVIAAIADGRLTVVDGHPSIRVE
ncbi:MAG TPA: phosphoribosylglycinamide formyltransferase [Firmicutes bacterium]|nr:phosphoribosylglycinamide formyltransferase [Bacillota bacterium]